MFLQFSKTRICAYKFGEYCKRKLWTDNNDFWKNTNTKKVKLVESIWCKTFVDDCAKYFCLDSIRFVIHNQTPIRTWASFKCGAKCLQFGRKIFTIWSKFVNVKFCYFDATTNVYLPFVVRQNYFMAWTFTLNRL